VYSNSEHTLPLLMNRIITWNSVVYSSLISPEISWNCHLFILLCLSLQVSSKRTSNKLQYMEHIAIYVSVENIRKVPERKLTLEKIIFNNSIKKRKFANVHTTTASRWRYTSIYEGWNFNSGNYLFTTDTK